MLEWPKTIMPFDSRTYFRRGSFQTYVPKLQAPQMHAWHGVGQIEAIRVTSFVLNVTQFARLGTHRPMAVDNMPYATLASSKRHFPYTLHHRNHHFTTNIMQALGQKWNTCMIAYVPSLRPNNALDHNQSKKHIHKTSPSHYQEGYIVNE